MSAGYISPSKISHLTLSSKSPKIYFTVKTTNAFQGFKAQLITGSLIYSEQNILTSKIVFKIPALRGDSSMWRWRRICFRALCTILETESLWIGTVADGSVSFDKAELILLFSAQIKHI